MTAKRTIDAHGLAVAPGFINMLSQAQKVWWRMVERKVICFKASHSRSWVKATRWDR